MARMGHHPLRAIFVATGLSVLSPTLLAWQSDDAEREAPPIPEGDQVVSSGITAEELRGHVQALSSDEMAGRPMGSVESFVAARYCAERLEAMGFRPGAEDGTYLQRIRMGRAGYSGVPELHLTTRDGDRVTLYYGEAFTFQSSNLVEATESLSCATVEEADQLPSEGDAHLAIIAPTAGRARRWLREAGLSSSDFGMLIVPRKASEGDRAMPKPDGGMRPVESGIGGLEISIVGEWGARVASGEIESIRFEPHAEHEYRDDANVVAILEGAGEERADEYVLLTAHRDHIGTRKARPNEDATSDSLDLIRNGADDDASGCAMVMEIAEALAAGERPTRSVGVVLVTGEERGMIGSRYWVDHPTVPLENVVCALNFEMLGRPDELVGGAGAIWLTGDDRSSLGPKLRETKIDVSPDPRLQMNFFARSDNVSFARKGVVSQTLSSFGGHGDYHRVTDEWDTLDYAHMQKAANICLAATRALASGDLTPAWNEGEPKL